MESHEGRLTVDEFLKLARGILSLVRDTQVSAEDQAKLDLAFSKLTANDSVVAGALSENQPVQKGDK